MRDKLIKILRVPIFPHELADPTEAVADYLLDNDVVPVVRCKDCKHYVQFLQDNKECRCTIFSGCYDRPYPTEPDDFCSYGERRTDDG